MTDLSKFSAFLKLTNDLNLSEKGNLKIWENYRFVKIHDPTIDNSTIHDTGINYVFLCLA